MADIISQDELDSLLSVYERSAVSSTRKTRRPSTHSVRLYDFASPEQFSRDQIRKLQLLNASFASNLSTYLSTLLRTPVVILPTTLDQSSFSDYLNSIPTSTLISTFRIDPVAVRSILEFNPNLVFTIVDYLTGGDGDVISADRDITDIETKLMESVIKSSLKHYIRAWELMGKTYCELERVGSSQAVNPIAGQEDRVLSSYFEAQIGNQIGMISICIPAAALEAVLDEIQDVKGPTPSGAQIAIQGIIAEQLGNTSIFATAVLGKANIAIKNLYDLAVGDCIRLEQPVHREIIVTVKGQPKYMAVPGTVSRRIGVQITRSVTEEDLA